jgi:hypothetical protein
LTKLVNRLTNAGMTVQNHSRDPFPAPKNGPSTAYLNVYKERVGLQARNVTDERSRINGLEERIDERLDQFVKTITDTQNHIFDRLDERLDERLNQFVRTITDTQNRIFERLEELNQLFDEHPESDKRTRSDVEDDDRQDSGGSAGQTR